MRCFSWGRMRGAEGLFRPNGRKRKIVQFVLRLDGDFGADLM